MEASIAAQRDKDRASQQSWPPQLRRHDAALEDEADQEWLDEHRDSDYPELAESDNESVEEPHEQSATDDSSDDEFQRHTTQPVPKSNTKARNLEFTYPRTGLGYPPQFYHRSESSQPGNSSSIGTKS